MLGKMFIHGLVAAILIGSAAAVYAQSKDNGYLSPASAPAATSVKADPRPAATGYVRPEGGVVRDRDGKHERKDKRDHERGHDRHHDKDDD
jgi:hypothetical protein